MCILCCTASSLECVPFHSFFLQTQDFLCTNHRNTGSIFGIERWTFEPFSAKLGAFSTTTFFILYSFILDISIISHSKCSIFNLSWANGRYDHHAGWLWLSSSNPNHYWGAGAQIVSFSFVGFQLSWCMRYLSCFDVQYDLCFYYFQYHHRLFLPLSDCLYALHSCNSLLINTPVRRLEDVCCMTSATLGIPIPAFK